MRVTPSLPQRGRQPKGEHPLDPQYPVSQEEFPIHVIRFVRKIFPLFEETKFSKILPVPPYPGEAPGRGILGKIVFV